MRAGDAFDILMGRQRSPGRASGPSMTPYLRAANVKDGKLDLADVQEMDFDENERVRYGLALADVLVSEGSGSADAVGAAAQWGAEIPGTVCFQNTLLRFRAREGLTLPGFVYQWCRWAFESGAFREAANGTNILHIGLARASEMDVHVPPLEAQRRIVDVMAQVDAHIAALNGEAAALDDLWWATAGALASTASGVSMVPLGELADISGGLTKNKNTILRGTEVDAPFLRVANVHRRFLDLTDVTTIRTTSDVVERYRLLDGDVLMNEGGDKDKLGRGAVWRGEIDNCIHQNHVFRIRLTSEDFMPEFVSCWSNSFGQRWFETFGTQTTGIASISKSTLSKFPIPRLPLSVQRGWSQTLDRTYRQLELTRESGSALEAVRTRLLSRLLLGEVTIPSTYDELTSGAA